MNDNLKKILELNNIPENSLNEALHKDILEMVLCEICEYMKKSTNNYVAIRKIYYQNSNNIIASKKALNKVCNMELPEKDLDWIDKGIRAFFHKKPTRRPITLDLRRELYLNQDGKCQICNEDIQVDTLHVDHIIPWDYVGDELKDNYQALCSFCNSHKSNNVSLTVSNLLFSKKGKKL